MQIAVRQWETQEQAERQGKHAGKHTAWSGRLRTLLLPTMRPMMRFNQAQWGGWMLKWAKALTLCEEKGI